MRCRCRRPGKDCSGKQRRDHPRARFGRPTVRLSRSRTATTRSPVRETPTSMAGLTRLTVSTIVKTRNRRPSTKLSVRKSRLQRS